VAVPCLYASRMHKILFSPGTTHTAQTGCNILILVVAHNNFYLKQPDRCCGLEASCISVLCYFTAKPMEQASAQHS
jgi:hypothetical protein